MNFIDLETRTAVTPVVPTTFTTGCNAVILNNLHLNH